MLRVARALKSKNPFSFVSFQSELVCRLQRKAEPSWYGYLGTVDQRSQFLIVRSGALEPERPNERDKPKDPYNPIGGRVGGGAAVGEASRSAFPTDARRVQHTLLKITVYILYTYLSRGISVDI